MPAPPPSSSTSLTFYPAYTFSSSPTYFTWVKLTTFQIHHTLRPHPSYTSTSSGSRNSFLLFYLNHPIQFVQIIGPVVAIEDFHERFWIITVDDGSGECIECIAWKPVKEEDQQQQQQEEEEQQSQQQIDKIIQKDKNLNEDRLLRDAILATLDLGSVVIAKGTISLFHGMRQLQLERISVVGDTNAEMAVIASRTRFLEEVLMQPWVVSAARQRKLLREAEGENAKEVGRVKAQREREVKLLEREKRYAARIAREWEVEEGERERVANEARAAGEEVKVWRRTLEREREMAEQEEKDELDDLAY